MSKKHTILVVEDEQSIRQMIRMTLEREGYHVLDCETAEDAKQIVKKEKVHLILLDWMLPGMSGISFAEKLRTSKKYKTMPIIMLTAKAEEDDTLLGFEAGVDDYVVKPFSIKELLARVQSVIRRSHTDEEEPETISHSGLTIDTIGHMVYTDAHDEIHLGPTEFRLLLFLMRNPGRVYSRDQLLDQVWGVGVYVDERTVDVHIRRLRRGLEPHELENVIRTVRGSGYSFNKPKK